MRNVLHRRLLMAAVAGACVVTGRGSWGQTAMNEDGPRVTMLSFWGAAVTKPALLYELLPAEQDVEPGNAATRYLSALTMLPKEVNEQIEQVDKYLDEPLGELDEKGAGELVGRAQPALKMAATGARTESADWGTNVRREGIEALLPSLGPVRTMSNLLALSIRLDIKAHRWVAAREELQTGFALARHLGEGETLIESLERFTSASSARPK